MADAAEPPAIASAKREGSQIEIVLEHNENAYGRFSCEPPVLLKASGDGAAARPLQDDRPRCGNAYGGRAGPYYLDGDYVDNPFTLACLGCDNGDPCVLLSARWSYATLEYVQVGTRPRPADDHDAGTRALAEVPVIESRDSVGPYVLHFMYVQNMCLSAGGVADLQVDVR